MKSIERFTGNPGSTTEHQAVTELGARMGKLPDRASHEVMMKYWEVLLKKPITYIVPVVWGADVGAPRDHVQKEMEKGIGSSSDGRDEVSRSSGVGPGAGICHPVFHQGLRCDEDPFHDRGSQGAIASPVKARRT